MAHTDWYHGGDFLEGKPKGTYLDVTDSRQHAEVHAGEHLPNGKVYRLRPEYHDLVKPHHDGGGRIVILQTDIKRHGGVLSIFEEVKAE
jgi:hypothetical protein